MVWFTVRPVKLNRDRFVSFRFVSFRFVSKTKYVEITSMKCAEMIPLDTPVAWFISIYFLLLSFGEDMGIGTCRPVCCSSTAQRQILLTVEFPKEQALTLNSMLLTKTVGLWPANLTFGATEFGNLLAWTGQLSSRTHFSKEMKYYKMWN